MLSIAKDGGSFSVEFDVDDRPVRKAIERIESVELYSIHGFLLF